MDLRTSTSTCSMRKESPIQLNWWMLFKQASSRKWNRCRRKICCVFMKTSQGIPASETVWTTAGRTRCNHIGQWLVSNRALTLQLPHFPARIRKWRAAWQHMHIGTLSSQTCIRLTMKSYRRPKLERKSHLRSWHGQSNKILILTVKHISIIMIK